MQFVLRAAPRQKAELAPNISGTLTHWVLENALRRQGAAFKDLNAEDLQALVEELVEEYTKANLPGITVRMQYLIERIRRNLVGLLGFIQRDLQQSGFQPVAFELRIDDRPGEDPDAPRVDPGGAGRRGRPYGADRGHGGPVDAMPLGNVPICGWWTTRPAARISSSRKSTAAGLPDAPLPLYAGAQRRQTIPGGYGGRGGISAGGPRPRECTPGQAGQDDTEGENNYPLNGLLLDDESIYHAMDRRCTGNFVPLNFSAKTGKVTNGKSRLADEKKLARIRDHLDGLLKQMSRNLYGGKIDAQPLCSGGRSPCAYCDFRIACSHQDGENERKVEASADPFAEE